MRTDVSDVQPCVRLSRWCRKAPVARVSGKNNMTFSQELNIIARRAILVSVVMGFDSRK